MNTERALLPLSFFTIVFFRLSSGVARRRAYLFVLRPPFSEMLRTAALAAARRMRTAGGSAAAEASSASSSSSSAAAVSAVSSMLAAVGITGAASLALCEKTPAAAAAAAPSFDPEALERGAKALREINKSANAKQVRN